ncbi:hypothetical protein JOQ06_023153 [Pogonophryne albipinna]|uniref:Homeobox domain-containing protein n=1 Tax=Pogonophryne albipinna TaxID=1090488 RepID=A0AAD6FU13_9TELE|nr:hypothetical protein JOQ06_023153 [Pogonophryne albipinna]
MECMMLAEEQTKVLEDSFTKTKYPDGTTLMLIAAECGLSEEDTQKVWAAGSPHPVEDVGTEQVIKQDG